MSQQVGANALYYIAEINLQNVTSNRQVFSESVGRDRAPHRSGRTPTGTDVSKVLAYQLSKRTYYYDKINTNVPSHRSNKEVASLAPLGKLNYTTGALIINPKTRKLLAKEGVWEDFNKSKSK